jgi:hypothetical protein
LTVRSADDIVPLAVPWAAKLVVAIPPRLRIKNAISITRAM